ncbi:ABC transporter ATP-binding protein [Haladaptatus pallidirubidus]|uniref:ABC-type D-xylose/L-arabinose transporter n=1 Tax=Haladaptatus pallidirubidus TaxID=1008152 RepID=A0AAV3UQ31_9EURY|nr:ABC transporter ATP-binding protein [Haladaptatus pallidirubidus]
MVSVTYESVEKRYGETLAVDNVDIDVEDGEFAVLLGPSGCGKTTTLRCLAGLTTPTAGSIYLGDYDVTDVHLKNRDIAMVFQNFALYPHMNVQENIGYPLKVAGQDEKTRNERAREVAEMVEIEELLDRDVDQLSGGQRQRVALARAMIRRPSVFLMDEPLASLDAKLKISMRSRIKVLQRELGITTLYVTHDQEEAMTLGDKLIIMDGGEIQQIGTPDDVYHEPNNQFVAGFIGSPSMNFIDVEWSDEQTIAHSGGISDFQAELDQTVAARYDEYDSFRLGIRPQYFAAHTTPTENAVPGRVRVTEPLGDEQLIDVVVGLADGESLDITAKIPNNITVSRNDDIWLSIQDALVHGFDIESGDRIEEADDARYRVADSPSTDGRRSETVHD